MTVLLSIARRRGGLSRIFPDVCSKEEKAGFLLHRYCPMSTTAEPAHRRIFPLSSTSLGLERHWIVPHLSSIQQLPEVSNALSSSSTSDLDRAVAVFASMHLDAETKATAALLAESLVRKGKYAEATERVKSLLSMSSSSREELEVQLATAKLLWLQGEFVSAKAICDEMLDQPLPDYQYEYAARTGHAINRLLLVESLDDVYSVRDPFRMVVKSLEGMPSHALAMAQLNFGAAEAVYAEVVGSERGMDNVPLDGALRSWNQGLTTLKRASSNDKTLLAALEARLQANMAWGLLQMKREKDNVKRASEFAGKALDIYDKKAGDLKEGFGRTLALVATCYHKSSSAVTAEGLFQSAVDSKLSRVTPSEKLELRDSYLAYSDLCRDWDRRAADADRLQNKASEIDATLPIGWQGKSGIHGSLWFWTPAMFQSK